MKKIITPEIEAARFRHPVLGCGDGMVGFFRFVKKGLNVMVGNGDGWEHVSVSRFNRSTPIWEEMVWVKDTFFEAEEWVVQYHPAKSDYIDYGRNVLHLWRAIGVEFPKPPKEMV